MFAAFNAPIITKSIIQNNWGQFHRASCDLTVSSAPIAGGVFVGPSASLELLDSKASWLGCAFAADFACVAQLINNAADIGGGVACTSSTTCILSGSQFIDNSAG